MGSSLSTQSAPSAQKTAFPQDSSSSTTTTINDDSDIKNRYPQKPLSLKNQVEQGVDGKSEKKKTGTVAKLSHSTATIQSSTVNVLSQLSLAMNQSGTVESGQSASERLKSSLQSSSVLLRQQPHLISSHPVKIGSQYPTTRVDIIGDNNDSTNLKQENLNEKKSPRLDKSITYLTEISSQNISNEKLKLFGTKSTVEPLCGSPLTISPTMPIPVVPETPLLSDYVPPSIDSSSEFSRLIARSQSSPPRLINVGFPLRNEHDFTSTNKQSEIPVLRKLCKQESMRLPTLLSWTGGGKTVYVVGTFNEWKQKIPLQKLGNEFTTVLHLTPGVHKLKFIVDGEWMCSHDLDTLMDHTGNLVNYIDVKEEEMLKDVGQILDDSQKASEAESGYETLPPFGQDIPAYLKRHDSYYNDASSGISSRSKSLSTSAASNDDYLRPLDHSRSYSSGDGTGFGQNSYTGGTSSGYSSLSGSLAGSGFSNALQGFTSLSSTSSCYTASPTRLPPPPLNEPPPTIPPHLEHIILNSSANLKQDDYSNESLPIPNHVCINHLYALSVKDGVMGLASTRRHKNKYITLVYYRPVQRPSLPY